ncbi:MAG: DUF1465 family protein [Emcibacter sp.]|nr:DUF1465 family protein [Emcibacter sp.]
MTQQNINENGLLNSRFLDKSYREAMELTEDVASYLEQKNEKLRGFNLEVPSEVHYASESMRVSTCLMQVMSWFLVQKGVASGEISKEEAGALKFRLGAEDICLAKVDNRSGNLPETFVTFLEKSQNLYRQVARMDRMVYGSRNKENPVHHLFEKLENKDIFE